MNFGLPRAGEANSPVCGMANLPLIYYDLPNFKGGTMADVIKEDQVLDCSGMLCPMPVVKTSKAIKELQSGQVLKMIATDPGAPPDMEAWSRQTGNELLRSMQEDGKFVFFFRKK
jgi:tRNA 2-thiouridine synthesizing protein A